jgi:hypothetical protein
VKIPDRCETTADNVLSFQLTKHQAQSGVCDISLSLFVSYIFLEVQIYPQNLTA